jgi:hypothetical protein
MIADRNQTPITPELSVPIAEASKQELTEEQQAALNAGRTVYQQKKAFEKLFNEFTNERSEKRLKITKNQVVNVIRAWSLWGFAAEDSNEFKFNTPIEQDLFELMLELESFRQVLWSAALKDLKERQADEQKIRELQGEPNGNEIQPSETRVDPSSES